MLSVFIRQSHLRETIRPGHIRLTHIRLYKTQPQSRFPSLIRCSNWNEKFTLWWLSFVMLIHHCCVCNLCLEGTIFSALLSKISCVTEKDYFSAITVALAHYFHLGSRYKNYQYGLSSSSVMFFINIVLDVSKHSDLYE